MLSQNQQNICYLKKASNQVPLQVAEKDEFWKFC